MLVIHGNPARSAASQEIINYYMWLEIFFKINFLHFQEIFVIRLRNIGGMREKKSKLTFFVIQKLKELILIKN
jgi:hypothetical protein